MTSDMAILLITLQLIERTSKGDSFTYYYEPGELRITLNGKTYSTLKYEYPSEMLEAIRGEE